MGLNGSLNPGKSMLLYRVWTSIEFILDIHPVVNNRVSSIVWSSCSNEQRDGADSPAFLTTDFTHLHLDDLDHLCYVSQFYKGYTSECTVAKELEYSLGLNTLGPLFHLSQVFWGSRC